MTSDKTEVAAVAGTIQSWLLHRRRGIEGLIYFSRFESLGTAKERLESLNR